MMKELFDFLQGARDFFLSFKTCRPAVVFIQFLLEWLLEALSPGVKQA
jgi:hypothetical protein